MDPIYKPLTELDKQKLEARGYKEWEYFGIPNYADPDSKTCKIKIYLYFIYQIIYIYLDHFCSLTVLLLSIIGRHQCRKHGHPVYGFNLNIAMIPVFYFFAFKKKHLEKSLDSVSRR
jgi:hypothetical protein